jgi:hypothetical protein
MRFHSDEEAANAAGLFHPEPAASFYKDHAMNVLKIMGNATLAAGFRVQSRNVTYWHICCRECCCAWYLPKNEARRTKEALTILDAHAAGHRHARA